MPSSKDMYMRMRYPYICVKQRKDRCFVTGPICALPCLVRLLAMCRACLVPRVCCLRDRPSFSPSYRLPIKTQSHARHVRKMAMSTMLYNETPGLRNEAPVDANSSPLPGRVSVLR